MKPTESELNILSILWEHGPSTVRFVNEQLNTKRRVGYTNTLKIMQIMHEKELLSRDETSRSHVYTPLIVADDIKDNMLNHMIKSIFGGDPSRLLVHALGSYKPSGKELEEIRALIENMEKDDKHI